jgi:UDP-N-acetylmuramoyl-L-alanyl-D-glutamate--2,6-diaminopimelate ligase
LEDEGIRVELGGDGLAALDALAHGCVVRSPGVRLDTPLLAAAAARGVTIVDELELGWRLDERPVVGVTGTNGKSTVAELSRAVLAAAGHRPAVAGNTMFGPPLSALPAEAADVVVAEVSSFQLEASPAFLADAVVVTNLTEDHQDRHASMDAYGELKRRIALRGDEHTPVAIVGIDQDFGRALAADLDHTGALVVRVGAHRGADVRLHGSAWRDGHADVSATAFGAPLELRLGLPGRHNALNALMALALAEALGVPRATAVEALAEAQPPPGRLEPVGGAEDFTILVDYAHNPDGVRAALEGARALTPPRGRLRVVVSTLWAFTDHHRRAVGTEAARAADDLVLTTDRVRATEPLDVLPPGFAEAAEAASETPPAIVAEREAAIELGLGGARPGDVVAILGRGARSYRVAPDGEVRPRDDHDIVRAALAARAPS